MQQILTTLWFIWRAWNDLRFRQRKWSILQVHFATQAHINLMISEEQNNLSCVGTKFDNTRTTKQSFLPNTTGQPSMLGRDGVWLGPTLARTRLSVNPPVYSARAHALKGKLYFSHILSSRFGKEGLSLGRPCLGQDMDRAGQQRDGALGPLQLQIPTPTPCVTSVVHRVLHRLPRGSNARHRHHGRSTSLFVFCCSRLLAMLIGFSFCRTHVRDLTLRSTWVMHIDTSISSFLNTFRLCVVAHIQASSCRFGKSGFD